MNAVDSTPTPRTGSAFWCSLCYEAHPTCIPAPPDSTPTEREVEVTTHWGARLPGGIVRWDPGRVPYTEAQARADVARNPGAVLATRAETVTTETTEWEDA